MINKIINKIYNFFYVVYWRIYYTISDFIYYIKWFLQRGKNGYADIDKWNFDEYVATLIRDTCFELSENRNGFPNGMTEKQWTQILKDISFGFGSYLEMRTGIYEIKDAEFKRLKKEYEKGLQLFIKYHKDLWD